MMRYSLMSTPSRSAAARALVSGRTWKPTMIAPDAFASRMSLSEIAPTPRCTISTCTSLVDSCESASASASAGPPWSALMTMRRVRRSPACACAMKSSRDTPPRLVRRLFASRSSRRRRREWTFAGVESRLDHRTRRVPVGVRLEVEDLGLEQDGVEKLVDVGSALGGDLRRQRLPSELLKHDAVSQ